MHKITCLLIFSVTLAVGVPALAPAQQQGGPYNVLFIMIDDHKPDFHSVFNAASPVKTPNMQRLAERGTWFTQGYVDAPACCPSRTALLTGVHTTKSGVYYNSHAYRRATSSISQVQTLPGKFLESGYLVAGYGKIAHNRFLEDDIGDYTPGYYKMLNRAADVTHVEDDLKKYFLPGSELDLTAILSGASKDRGKPVLSTYGQGCHSLRDGRFRFTRYRDGSEELYDHRYDPHEWNNLAADPQFASAKARLAAHLPTVNADPIVWAGEAESRGDDNGWPDTAFD